MDISQQKRLVNWRVKMIRHAAEGGNVARTCRRFGLSRNTFDKRGNGLSDRIVGAPSLEERMDDLRAVMDAAGSERAALFGNSEGGPMSALFAATDPTRTLALILYGSFARFLDAPDCPAGVTCESCSTHPNVLRGRHAGG